MEAVRQWLLSVTAAALVLALAEALAPEGGAKRVCRLAGGLALVLAAAGPVAGLLDGGAAGQAVQSWREEAGRYERELEEGRDLFYLTIIEEETAAYIVDKAAQLGAACSARTECRRDGGLYLPQRVEVTGAVPPPLQSELVQIIVRDLGVPEEQIDFSEEEAP